MTGNRLRLFAAGVAALATAPSRALGQEAPPAGTEWHHSLPGQFTFQEPVTPIMESIVVFHDGVLMWTITLITLLVLALLIIVMVRFNAKAHPIPTSTTHNTLVEVLWTVLPIIILVVIAIPSFGVLADQLRVPDGERKYLGAHIFSSGDVEVPAASLTIKATGNTWFWNYEYVDQGETISSNMMFEEDRLAQKPHQPRLLAVDNELVVPVNTTVRVLVTADPGGVIHAFAVPSFGIKIDAVPGRINETWFNAEKLGLYYGQCSELCGKDHAFMPIAVRVVTEEEFATWMETLQAENLRAANATLTPVT